MNTNPEVAIVGAGPYGLSIAAHLRAMGVPFRIFGAPMQTWRETMPLGMLLKSDGFASNLSDPHSAFTLKSFCQQNGIPYDDTRVPVALDTFNRYGQAFQRAMVPELESVTVSSLSYDSRRFHLQLETGETLTAGRVVLAVGISHFAFMPPELASLPSHLASHASAHRTGERFRGQRVAVVGAGASAVDVAAMLVESGAEVEVVARHPIKFHAPPGSGRRSLAARLRHPPSGIGPGLRSRLYTEFPWLFRYLPAELRLQIVKRHLGPAASWSVRDRVVGRVAFREGYVVRSAEATPQGVRLTVAEPGRRSEHTVEATHIVSATGYKIDLHRLPFLDTALAAQIRAIENAPVLSAQFESSVPGLFFVGLAAAPSFGPVLRFACGSSFAAPRLARHLKRVTLVSRKSQRAAGALAQEHSM